MAVSESRACCPTIPHGRDKSGPYISRNELRARDDEAFLCDEKHTLKPANDGKKMHACIVPKMAIYCLCCRDPIYRVRRGGEGQLSGQNFPSVSFLAPAGAGKGSCPYKMRWQSQTSPPLIGAYTFARKSDAHPSPEV